MKMEVESLNKSWTLFSAGSKGNIKKKIVNWELLRSILFQWYHLFQYYSEY